MKQKVGEGSLRIKYPLAVKLIATISIIVVISMGVVTALSSWFFSEDSRARAEENNLTLSEVVAAQLEGRIDAVHSSALSLFDVLRNLGGGRTLERSIVADFFDRNPTVAYILVPGKKEIYNDKFFKANELDRKVVAAATERCAEAIRKAQAGETSVTNEAPAFGIPAAALVFPYRDLGADDVMVILFSTEEIQTIVQSGSTSVTYAVDGEGALLAHPDFELLKLGADFSDEPVVAELLKSATDNKQIRYKDKSGAKYLGAIRRLSTGRLGVVTTLPLGTVYRAAQTITRQNLYLTGIVLLFSILAVWFLSRAMTRPVKLLTEASRKIEEGEFLLDLKATTQDELGILTESFVHMGKGLAERERMKDTFGKFVNKEIAELALKGDLVLGGTRKTATIFFSDIRSFTAISENMEPEAVVEFLNDYMTRMVDCIEKTHGVVDKFIGDAIMGVWGAPISQGSSEADALNAISAMLMMRTSLAEFNAGRGGPEKPLLRIGCGVNTGPCLAGQIGSLKRMEYTVIGDAVNLASRIEALNKPFHTDILVSENTYELLKDKLIVEPMPPIKVKGKTDPLQIYAVVNMVGEKGPASLAEVRSLLGIDAPEGIVDVDKEEVKYEIIKK